MGIINIDPYMKKLVISKEPPIEVLRFISQQHGIEVGNFYEMLRKNHNQKKSPLYTNIVKDITDPDVIITTLSCLVTQIILYSKKLDNRVAFLQEVRAEEITRALNIYFKTEDISMASAVLKLVKADLLVMEYINGRRELAVK